MLKLPIRTEAAFLALCARYHKDPARQLEQIVEGYLLQVAAIERQKARAASEAERARLTEIVRGKVRA